nr:hypothetical protein [uncultured Cupriavidus sp.]
MDSFHRGDWLALAQSVASLVAIIGAFGVVFVQHHLDKTREKAAENARREKALTLSVWTVQQLYDITAALQKSCEQTFVNSFGEYAMEQFRDLRAAISMLPMSELEERHAIALLVARNTTNKVIAVIHIARTQLPPNEAEDYLSQQLSNLAHLIRKELRILKDVAAESGKPV